MSQTEIEWLVVFFVLVPMGLIGVAAVGQMLWWDYQDEKLMREERERVWQQLEDASSLTKEQFRVLVRRRL